MNTRTATPQEQAADPRHSVWVSANAGSGKTTVLSHRVIRLLMSGVAPARILCLTYTKAAAAHMANKVLGTLAGWARLDDEALAKEIAKIDPVPPDTARLLRARQLFAAALETPGGLKVQTIHAFCDRVLHMFPVEARVPAGFEVLDELGANELIDRARIDALLEAGRTPESKLGRAFSCVSGYAGDDAMQTALREAVQARRAGGILDPDRAAEALAALLELEPGETPAVIEQGILENALLPRSEWMGCAATLKELGGNAAKIGALLDVAARAPEYAVLQRYLEVFVAKTTGTPKADRTLGSEDSLATVPHIRLREERDRIASLLGKLCAARERERSLALLALANDVIARYESAKKARGTLDFADLVTKTVALLEREESAWVHFKLDGGIEHILVDEAQDTSPEQWKIIAKLSEEFFAGIGASEKHRTVFAVGDEKQSIFSFQGADPKSFDEMRGEFTRRVAAAGTTLVAPKLKDSWRSTQTVLNAVDTVFQRAAARAGLSVTDPSPPEHLAVRANAPGMVEIWQPAVSKRDEGDDEGWQAPLDMVRNRSAPMVLAKQIADAIVHWTSGGLSVGERNFSGTEVRHTVRPGEIIVLVQKRGVLFDSILRVLKERGVPVAGADRLRLTEHIAVMDLMALGDALLLARDDLQLACALKSPLFGLNDDDLYTLAFDRRETLAERLNTHAQSEPRFAAAAAQLARWREEAAHARPFDFYARVLGRDGGRKRFVARLGLEAADALDEFLSLALSYESLETPSLQGFLSFLRRAGVEVKRDLEAQSDAVRVMTVHGVKGLEAPVVVLADTTTLPDPRNDPKLVPVATDTPAWLWALNKKEESATLAEACTAARGLRHEEYRRLLYVALTRAADVLVVAGMLNDNRKEPETGSWYELVNTALRDDAAETEVAYSETPVLRWRTQDLPPADTAASAAIAAKPDLPPWLAAAHTEEEKSLRRVRPSFATPKTRTRDGASAGGLARGLLVHRLLQSLPELAPAQRLDASARYLAAAASALDEETRRKLAAEAVAVVEDPLCAGIFGEDSRAEVEAIARLPGEHGEEIEIAGRLDRIRVTPDEVLFADFKSDMRVPRTSGEIPEHYVAQLAAYRAGLGRAFPGRAIRALLIFTAGPRVFEIPAGALETGWNRLKTQSAPATP